MASLRMYLACGLLLYVLLCSSSSMHIRRMDKGLALTSSLLPNFTHKFAIRIEAYLLALSHPSHFRHTYPPTTHSYSVMLLIPTPQMLSTLLSSIVLVIPPPDCHS